MRIVGLTGGIGSGKTTVANMFSELGVPVYNSDVEAKKLMHSSKTVKKGIRQLFGDESYLDGKLNRSYIAEIVFRDKIILDRLNKIVHPEVKKDFQNWCATQDYDYVVQETALLFENNAQDFYDKVVLVTAPINLRIKRLLERDDTSEQDILARMENQLNDGDKIPFADFIIDNIDLEDTRLSVQEVHEALLKFCQQK